MIFFLMGEFFELGRSIFQEERGLQFLESVINYLYKATNIETDIVVESIAGITTKGGEFAMSTAERLRQEGRQEGILSIVHHANKQGISAETIAKIVDLDITLINKILNHEEIEVPLYLLDSESNR